MFQLNSIIITIILFFLIVGANEIGLRIGEYYENKSGDDTKSQTTAIQGGIIGMLALILGFTFSMAVQRFDNRAAAEIAEANAIGTAILRTNLLPEPKNKEAEKLIEDYIRNRLKVNQTDLTDNDIRNEFQKSTLKIQQAIWDLGIEAAKQDPNPVTSGLFISSVNDMIDMQGKRNDQLRRQVPPAIFYLLFVIFIATGGLTGYASGLGKKSSRLPSIVLSFLICLMVFIIIDLDRPRRGTIQVKQDSMKELTPVEEYKNF